MGGRMDERKQIDRASFTLTDWRRFMEPRFEEKRRIGHYRYLILETTGLERVGEDRRHSDGSANFGIPCKKH